MLMHPHKWHRGRGYGGLEEGFNVAQCQATVTAAHDQACCIRCSLLCVAPYATKHKCVFPLMRTEVELLGHPRRTWLGQQMIWSGASSKDWTEVAAAALKTAARTIRFQKMCWIWKSLLKICGFTAGFLDGRKGYAPMSTFSHWFGFTLLYQIIPQGVSSKPGSLQALLFGIRG